MTLGDIRLENDLCVYIGSKLDAFKNLINKMFGTQNIDFLGTEWCIRNYHERHSYYRVDMMFGNKEMYVPIELKYDANADSYYQIKQYVEMLEENKNKKINGILLCIHATRSLKELQINNNIAVLELSTGKWW